MDRKTADALKKEKAAQKKVDHRSQRARLQYANSQQANLQGAPTFKELGG